MSGRTSWALAAFAVVTTACGRSNLEQLELASTPEPAIDAGVRRPPTGGAAGGPPMARPPEPPTGGTAPGRLDGGPPLVADAGVETCTPADVLASSWPMMGHDPRGTGNEGGRRRAVAEVEAITTTWSVGLAMGDGRDALSDGARLYVPAERDSGPAAWGVTWRVHSMTTGALLCVLPTTIPTTLAPDDPGGFAPALADGLLFARRNDPVTGRAALGAYDAANGDLVWEIGSFVDARWPLVIGDLVVGTGGGRTGTELDTPRTMAVRSAEGRVAWESVGPSPDGVECGAVEPVPSGDADWGRVFVRSECSLLEGGFRRTLHAHDLGTGEPLWAIRDDAVLNRDGYSISGTGDLGLQRLLSRGMAAGPGPLLFEDTGGRRLVGEAMGQHDMVAFDADTGEVVWQTPVHPGGLLRGMFGHRALAGGRVVVAANGAPLSDPALADGRSLCSGFGLGCFSERALGAVLMGLDTDTGATAWTLELPGLVTAGLVATGPMVFVVIPGELLVVDATDGSVAARFDLDALLDPTPLRGSVVWGQPIFASDMLVLRVGDATTSLLYGLHVPGDVPAGDDAGIE